MCCKGRRKFFGSTTGRGKRPERGLRESEEEGELPIIFAELGVNTMCEEWRAVRGNRKGGGEP